MNERSEKPAPKLRLVKSNEGGGAKVTDIQRRWLKRGLAEPGGKLPLFDENGQKVSSRTVKSCVRQGWAEPWFKNPIKKDWLVCKLTDEGRRVIEFGG